MQGLRDVRLVLVVVQAVESEQRCVQLGKKDLP